MYQGPDRRKALKEIIRLQRSLEAKMQMVAQALQLAALLSTSSIRILHIRIHIYYEDTHSIVYIYLYMYPL